MTKSEWLELIEKHESDIIQKGIEAYRQAAIHRNLEYIVEIDEHGVISIWYTIAGGNSFHSSTFEGASIEIFRLCFQYSEPNITEEAICEKLREKGLEEKIKELCQEAEEDDLTVELVINKFHKELSEVLEECEKDAIEYDVSEYAEDVILEKLKQAKYL